MNNIITPAPGTLRVRAYCTDCGKLLQESNPLTKKQLIANWNSTVMGALSMSCKDCGNKSPNVHIELRIYNSKLHTEVLPQDYKPLKLTKAESAKAAEQVLDAFRRRAEVFAKEHPEEAKQIDEELETKMVSVTEDGAMHHELSASELREAIQKEVERRNKLRNKNV